jgi:hypothetical protein
VKKSKHKKNPKDDISKNYNTQQQDIHYKVHNFLPSKNYSNSSYNKSYYINPEPKFKPQPKMSNFNNFNYESNSSYILASTNKSSDSETGKNRFGESKNSRRSSDKDSNTETDFDTIDDFIETHGVHLASYLCTQKGSRYICLIQNNAEIFEQAYS